MIGPPIPPEEFDYGLGLTAVDPASLSEAVRAVVADAMANPTFMTTWLGMLAIAEQTVGLNMLRRLNGENPDPVMPLGGDDKRFADPAWKSNPFLNGAVEDYAVRLRAAQQLVDASRLPEATRRKARFAISMMMDAFAPSNVPWLNPVVVKEAMNTGGTSLVRGLQNFLEDVQHNGGQPRQVDTSGFKVGKNLGATPGRVVFRNNLIELIAYEPQTDTVHEVPLLCSPPWINKYYIMDLAPGRSFVEWAVRNRHQTFMISYRNPDASMASYTMDDYLREGILEALDVVERITRAKKINLMGLCLGGTIVTIALAYLAAKGKENRISSASITNTLVDFSEPGELGVFTDEASVNRLEEKMRERGFLDSKAMAGTFNALRSNDLIWSYVVNNWFMGKTPPAFDILAWNGDSTRMPATMHSQYLRACYLDNALVKPKAYVTGGVPLDLGKIHTPMYVLAAETDHIAPWRTVFATTQYVGGESKFTLTNAGHIAGIVNPPGNPKSFHWTKRRTIKGESPQAWLESADRHEGSWWLDWTKWIAPRAGALVKPRALPAGEPAPGRYVFDEVGAPFDAAPPRRGAATRQRAPKSKPRKQAARRTRV